MDRPSLDGMSVRLAASPAAGRRPVPWHLELANLESFPVHIRRIPAGLWLRLPGGADLSEDEVCSEAPDQNRMYIVLGAPGEQPPDPRTVADLLRALPDTTRAAAVLCWYGGSHAGGAVADALAASVRTVHGVPSDGALVFVDEDGVECWQPFAQESVYRPAGPPRLTHWVPPPGLLQVEPASFGLVDGWRVDVVPRGLLVRPESVPAMPAWRGATGPTADVVVVSAEDVGVPIEVVIALDDVLRYLPEETVQCLRLLPVDTTAAEALGGSEHADVVVYGEVDVALPAAVRMPEPLSAPERPSAPASEPETARATRPALAGPSPGLPDEFEPPVGTVIVTTDGRVIPAEPIVARSAVPRDMPVATGAATRAPWQGAGAASQIHAGNQPPGRVGDGSPAATPAVVAPANSRPATAVAGLPPSGPATASDPHRQPPPPARPQAPPPASPPPAQPPAMSVPDGALTSQAPPPAAVSSDVVTSDSNAVASAVDSITIRPAAVAKQPAAVAALGSEDELLPTNMVTVSQLQPPSSAERASQPRVDQQPRACADEQPRPETAQPAEGKQQSQEKQSEEKQASPLPPVASRPAQVAAVEVPEEVRSTAEQRRGMRKKLGSPYDTATKAVTRLLSERPGLRFGAGDDAALLAELSVVRVFADNPAGSYDKDFYVCLADGLRRLPTARAVVVRDIPAGLYVRPEMVVRIPVPVLASPASTAPPSAGAEALIWTTSGRRLDGLLDDVPAGKEQDQPTGKARPKDVVLSGHTRLRVLAVESDPVQRLLLAEDGVASEAALTRLRAAATARTVVAASQPASGSNPWFQISSRV